MKKLILIFILLGGIGYSIFWLWQRQPKSPNEQVLSEESKTSASPEAQTKDSFPAEPADSTVLSSAKVTFKGTATENSLVAIYSNNISSFAKSDSKGSFRLDATLAKGLNLVSLSAVTPDLNTGKAKTITLYVSPENSSKVVYAGTVKTIFDTLITLTTSSSEKNVRTLTSTSFDIPQGQKDEESTASPVQNIRIGDYSIALGSKENDSLIASKFIIIRDSVPANSEFLAVVKIVAGAKQNAFTAKTIKDQKLIDFTINKNSDLLLDLKDAKASDIAKDKNAVVIYHPEKEDNVVDSINILP